MDRRVVDQKATNDSTYVDPSKLPTVRGAQDRAWISMDVCMLIDATGSMESIFPQAREFCLSLEHVLACRKMLLDTRVAVVAYRDFGDGSRQLEKINFGGRRAAAEFIKVLKPHGGDDYPEDVLGGLSSALALDWRDGSNAKNTLLLIHLADAPGHGDAYRPPGASYVDNHPGKATDSKGATLESLARLAGQRAIDYMFVHCNANMKGKNAKQMVDMLEAAYNSGPPVRSNFQRCELGADATDVAKRLLNCTTASIALTSLRSGREPDFGAGHSFPAAMGAGGSSGTAVPPSSYLSFGSYAPRGADSHIRSAPASAGASADPIRSLLEGMSLKATRTLTRLGVITSAGRPSGVVVTLTEDNEDELDACGVKSTHLYQLVELGLIKRA